MPTMPGKIALLELLKQEGVRVMFGNPGTTELPLMDAFAAEHDIRYVLALQEAPAMGMADGYAQASGQLACVNLHAAPVYDEGMATRAMFPSSHPLYRGALVRMPAAIRGMLEQHDLLVSIGADLFTLSLPDDVDAMPEGMRVVHLDTNPWELGKNYPAEVAIL